MNESSMRTEVPQISTSAASAKTRSSQDHQSAGEDSGVLHAGAATSKRGNVRGIEKPERPNLTPATKHVVSPRRWLKPADGILNDIRARLPFYVSDWKDAYNYRVVPAVVLIFFAK
jgi:hypothetical protein